MTAGLGVPSPRQDGPAKVTGAARHAADHVAEGMLHGVLVGAGVPGVRAIDADGARAVDGISACSRTPRCRGSASRRFRPRPRCACPCRTLRSATRASRSRSCSRRRSKPPNTRHRWCRHRSTRRRSRPTRAEIAPARELPRESGYLFGPTDAEHGDVERAIAGAEVRHEATYVQPSRHHNPIEPSATLAEWHGDTLTMVDATQWAYDVRIVMCALFGVPPERVRVRAPHVGGAFGCKGLVWPHQIIAAAAARTTGRPVRIALSRAQMYSTVPYQPQMVQTVLLAASGDGRLAAIEHESINVTSVSDDFVEYATLASQTTYAAPAIRVASECSAPTSTSAPRCARRSRGAGCGRWAAR